jgi:chromosome segregation ATPase
MLTLNPEGLRHEI